MELISHAHWSGGGRTAALLILSLSLRNSVKRTSRRVGHFLSSTVVYSSIINYVVKGGGGGGGGWGNSDQIDYPRNLIEWENAAGIVRDCCD